jgi:hypothetical protein
MGTKGRDWYECHHDKRVLASVSQVKVRLRESVGGVADRVSPTNVQ